MSVSGKETADADDNVLRTCDDADDGFGKHRRKEKGSRPGISGKFTRAKQLLLCSSFPRNSNSRPTSSEGRCLFCIGRPRTSESPVESHSSDPSDPAFTHEMLRALLEKNDFYSKECNPHFDVDDLVSCNRT